MYATLYLGYCPLSSDHTAAIACRYAVLRNLAEIVHFHTRPFENQRRPFIFARGRPAMATISSCPPEAALVAPLGIAPPGALLSARLVATRLGFGLGLSSGNLVTTVASDSQAQSHSATV